MVDAPSDHLNKADRGSRSKVCKLCDSICLEFNPATFHAVDRADNHHQSPTSVHEGMARQRWMVSKARVMGLEHQFPVRWTKLGGKGGKDQWMAGLVKMECIFAQG